MKVYKLREDCKNIIKCLAYPDKFEDEIKALENLANIEFPSASKVSWVTSHASSCRYAMVKFSIQDFDVEEVYDPNDWNAYPEVTPPKDELFMVWVTGKDCVTEPKVGKTFPDSDALYIHNGYTWVLLDTSKTNTVRYKKWG